MDYFRACVVFVVAAESVISIRLDLLDFIQCKFGIQLEIVFVLRCINKFSSLTRLV